MLPRMKHSLIAAILTVSGHLATHASPIAESTVLIRESDGNVTNSVETRASWGIGLGWFDEWYSCDENGKVCFATPNKAWKWGDDPWGNQAITLNWDDDETYCGVRFALNGVIDLIVKDCNTNRPYIAVGNTGPEWYCYAAPYTETKNYGASGASFTQRWHCV